MYQDYDITDDYVQDLLKYVPPEVAEPCSTALTNGARPLRNEELDQACMPFIDHPKPTFEDSMPDDEPRTPYGGRLTISCDDKEHKPLYLFAHYYQRRSFRDVGPNYRRWCTDGNAYVQCLGDDFYILEEMESYPWNAHYCTAGTFAIYIVGRYRLE